VSDEIYGEKLWDIETAFYTNWRGIGSENARIFTVLRWMWHGDFRPLAAAIDEGQVLDQAILNLLATMISEGRLKLIPRKGRGRPKAPSTYPRNIVAGLAYEHRRKEGHDSEEAFRFIADELSMSEENVRRAVTAWRKSRREHNAK
jgi:hypothetical protein